MSINALSSAQFRRAAEIKDQIGNLEIELNRLLGEPVATISLAPVEPVVKKRKKVSAAGRKRMATAQRARWAKINASKK